MNRHFLWLAAAFVATTSAMAQTASKSQTPKTAATASPAPTLAPVSSEPESTTANFGDWILHCTRVQGATQRLKLCEVVQSIVVQGQSNPIAQIALGRVAADEPLKVTAVLPNNVSFPSDVSLAINEKDPLAAELSWRRCLPGGCFADADVKEELATHWRSQTEKGTLKFKDGAGRDVVLPFSFRGLAQALDALEKS